MRTRKTSFHAFANERGFTLLEAVVAMAVLAFGVLTVCMMQGNALRASTVAYNRTEANNLAMALVEALQQLPFTDDMLEATPASPNNPKQGQDPGTASDFEKGSPGRAVYYAGELSPDEARCCPPAGGNERLTKLLEPVLSVSQDDSCEVRDRSGIPFTLKWAVQNVNVFAGADQSGKNKYVTTDKIIRVFMEWDTPAGRNHLEYTANKYNNETNAAN